METLAQIAQLETEEKLMSRIPLQPRNQVLQKLDFHQSKDDLKVEHWTKRKEQKRIYYFNNLTSKTILLKYSSNPSTTHLKCIPCQSILFTVSKFSTCDTFYLVIFCFNDTCQGIIFCLTPKNNLVSLVQDIFHPFNMLKTIIQIIGNTIV